MTGIDWAIVLVFNLGVVAYGVHLARRTTTSDEWLVGARSLPWWAVGMSMFATNVDNADLVSVAGTTSTEGMHIIAVHTTGTVLAGILAAFLVVPAMYRAGHYTNAEYLEARFGVSTRVLSALIQIQYRSSMLGLMVWALHILLTRLIGVPPGGAWALVVAMVALVGLYTAWGGLRSVVFTDVVQGLMVFLGAAVILHAAWSGAGGWDGARESLAAIDPAGTPVSRPLAGLPRMSSYRGDDGATPPAVVFIGWLIVAGGYWTVNHTQTMRLMGTRSLWDMRMAALLGTAVSAPVMVACAMLGVFGRALFPGLEPADEMYPALIERYLGPGLKGLVVAGVLAAAMSTFDSMGSALSAVFTRDVWRRLVVRGRDEAYYLRVSRWSTVAILALGFLYIPFIAAKKTMLEAFLTLIPVFVTPLFVLYLAGTLTRAHPRSGIAGLVAGAAYGVVALCDRELDLARLRWLPSWFTGRWEAFLWSAAITAATMALVTAALGRDGRPPAAGIPVREHPFARRVPAWLEPRWLAAVLLVATTSVVLVFFW